MPLKEKKLTLEIPTEDGKKEEMLYIVREPSSTIVKRSEVFRARMWRKYVQEDGLMCRKELNAFMSEKNIWTEDEARQETIILTQLAKMEKMLFLGKDGKPLKLSEGQAIAESMQILRLQLRALIAEKMQLEENTAESMAENAKFDFLVSECCFYEASGNRVFSDLDDYLRKCDDDVSYELATTLASMVYQLDEDYQDKLPETKFLKENGIIDDEGYFKYVNGKPINRDEEGNLLNNKGQKVDSEGNLLDENGNYVASVKYVDDLTPKTPKKRTAKKRITKKKKVTPKSD